MRIQRHVKGPRLSLELYTFLEKKIICSDFPGKESRIQKGTKTMWKRSYKRKAVDTSECDRQPCSLHLLTLSTQIAPLLTFYHRPYIPFFPKAYCLKIFMCVINKLFLVSSKLQGPWASRVYILFTIGESRVCSLCQVICTRYIFIG